MLNLLKCKIVKAFVRKLYGVMIEVKHLKRKGN